MTTYNPRSVFQSYEQYGRAKTKQAQSSKPKNANQQAARTMSSVGVGGLGGKPTTSAAQKIQDRFRRETQRDSGSTYDEVPQTITTGLGSRKAQDTKDESMSVGTKIDRAFVKVMTSLIPDFSPPEEQAVFPLKVYGGPLFRVPTPTPVTIQQLDDAARDTSRTFAPTAMETPTLPTTATDSDTGLTTPRGLMSPPTMTQPEKPRGLMGIPRALARANAVPTAAYQVQSGDTLSEIAAATGTTVKELADLNQISDVDVIEAGADIQIPIKRLEDEAVVTQATSMEDLKPIKASFRDVDPDAKFYNSFNEEAGSSPERFILRLAGSESSGNPDAEYTVEDGRRFVGLLQFGKARLTDYKRDTGAKFTQDEFKKDLKLQGDVSIWHINDIDKAIDSVIDNSAFKNRDGLRAVAHLGGKTGMKKFVQSNGEYNPEDELGTSLLDYYMKFSN
tara:strand:+ start:1001 stop:2344 length:1344 start_codon:yes stop_codon:yes gene_type:complete